MALSPQDLQRLRAASAILKASETLETLDPVVGRLLCRLSEVNRELATAAHRRVQLDHLLSLRRRHDAMRRAIANISARLMRRTGRISEWRPVFEDPDAAYSTSETTSPRLRVVNGGALRAA